MKISSMLRRIADWIDPPDMDRLRERIEAAQMRVFMEAMQAGRQAGASPMRSVDLSPLARTPHGAPK